jgi:hypothetical protein
VVDATETSNAAGEILRAFVKTGPLSPEHAEKTRLQILDLARGLATAPEKVSAQYARQCKAFLNTVKKVKGLPTREIRSEHLTSPELVGSSGQHIAKRFDELLPAITDAYERCVEVHGMQARQYYADQIDAIDTLVTGLLKRVPAGGTKDKLTSVKITEIKRELRALSRWPELFYIYKAQSFPSEIDHIFSMENGPIAVRWNYSSQDEQGEYRKTYDHKRLHDRVFAIRGNWAIEQGLMTAEPSGYLDEIVRPGHEIGCMCRLTYLTSLRSLPPDMLTAHGRTKLIELDTRMDEFLHTGKVPVATTSTARLDRPVKQSIQIGHESRLLRVLRRLMGRKPKAE